MTASIPTDIIKGWISELRSILKAEVTEGKIDLTLNQGMRHGLDQIEHKVTTWLRHQANIKTLSLSGQRLLITKDVNLSDGRYRKIEWYEGDVFVVLAWRHARHAEEGELMLEIHQVEDLSNTYLVYRGALSFGDLAALAREGGMKDILNEGNPQECVEKVWT